MIAKLIKNFTCTLLLGVLCTVFLNSCQDDPRKQVDVEEVEAEISIRRFEEDVMAMDVQHLSAGVAGLKSKYPDFFDFYTRDIMRWDSADIEDNFRIYLTHPMVKNMMDTIRLVHGDFKENGKILQDGFKRFAHHFPNYPLPGVVTAFSEFSSPTATDSVVLVINLEMFMGADFPYYPGFDLPGFKIRRMSKEYIPAVAMNAWYDQVFEQLPKNKNRFLDRMIEEGKKMYYLELMLPKMADSLRTEWSTDQLKWLKENEFQMWTYYIEHKQLYSSDAIEFSSLLLDGPFTAAPNVPPDSAPRIGVYSGWQIVRKYMAVHPELGLLDLFMEKDSDKILKESGYRP